MKDHKNFNRLSSFIRFCYDNKELRFWQALHAWVAKEYKKEIEKGELPFPNIIYIAYDDEAKQETFYLE